MNRFLFLTIDGLSKGAIFAAFALALVLIHRATRIVNFSQGAMAVASAYIAYSVTAATGSYWIGLLAAVVSGLLIGALIERGVMRFVSHTAPLNAVIVALGVVLVIQAILGFIYSNEYLPADAPFSTIPFVVDGLPIISPFDIFVFCLIGTVVVFLTLLFTRTSVGLRLRASAFAPEVSRLLGVNVARMRTLGWALAAAVGAMAAMLVIPTELGLNPGAMDLVFVSAFTAAVVGGLDSPSGAVIGGLGVGLLLSYVAGYSPWGDVSQIAIIVMLLLVLLIKPSGLFSGVSARRV